MAQKMDYFPCVRVELIAPCSPGAPHMETLMTNRAQFLSIGLVIACLALPTLSIAQTSVDDLARDVDRAESMRAVKQLQRTYAQYSQYGLWSEMADLFAEGATYTFDTETVKGRKAIALYIATREGDGQQGLKPGAVHTQIIDHPVVNLSVDGESAKGRWYGFFLLSDSAGNASIQGGVFENVYVREGGRWKIGSYRFFPQYAGPYRDRLEQLEGPGPGHPSLPFHAG